MTEDGPEEILPKNWPSEGRVEFENVSMRYKPKTPLRLTGLSMMIEPGHRVGVVGRTGAGKSTICLVLSRIIELAGGKMIIDGK